MVIFYKIVTKYFIIGRFNFGLLLNLFLYIYHLLAVTMFTLCLNENLEINSKDFSKKPRPNL